MPPGRADVGNARRVRHGAWLLPPRTTDQPVCDAVLGGGARLAVGEQDGELDVCLVSALVALEALTQPPSKNRCARRA
jgi:hypothetical protein